jgi:hypothetical protein
MAADVITLGEVAARGAEMIEFRCGRCGRHGCLAVARLLAEHGPDAAMGAVIRAQVGDCPKRDASEIVMIQYCPDLPQPFRERRANG